MALVSEHFFRTIALPLLQGRTLSIRDNAIAPRVAVVSRRLAERLFPEQAAIGRYIRVGQRPDRQRIEIVGVVADARLYDARDSNTAAVYLSHLQEGDAGFYNMLLLKTRPTAHVSSADIARAVASLGVEDVTWVRRLTEIRASAILEETIAMVVAASFGLFALVVAAIGVYGTMAFAVSSRRTELAVRAALGADRVSLLRTICGQMVGLLLLGIAIGVPMSLMASTITRQLLFDVAPGDFGTLFAASCLLFIVGVTSAYGAARAVCNAPPSNALRV